jgi:purine-nucleoside phosphorylase
MTDFSNAQFHSDNSFRKVQESAQFLQIWNGEEPVPEVVVVLGSGLANAIPGLTNLRSLSFSEIPGFQTTRIDGHVSELRTGTIRIALPNGKSKSRSVAFLRGRVHAYEGFSASEVVHNVRSVVAWGAKAVILTNAAGCLQPTWPVGSLMMIADHINFTGLNPLIGTAARAFGQQFQDMTSCYDSSIKHTFLDMADLLGLSLYEGVYAGVLGPSYETPAEIRMFQKWGADAVGMSTVLEAIAAKHMGAKVGAMSCLTNLAAGLSHSGTLSHEEVLDEGRKAAESLARLILSTAVSLEL